MRIDDRYVQNHMKLFSKRQSQNLCCDANVNFGDHVFKKSSSEICTYMRIYTYVKSSLPKHNFFNLALALQAHFLKWRFMCFGKELFTYLSEPIIIEALIGLLKPMLGYEGPAAPITLTL